jgi:hypothetical protein
MKGVSELLNGERKPMGLQKKHILTQMNTDKDGWPQMELSCGRHCDRTTMASTPSTSRRGRLFYTPEAGRKKSIRFYLPLSEYIRFKKVSLLTIPRTI